MTNDHLMSRIDDILEGYQFHRSGSLWNRDSADFIDVIDLQISKSKDIFTMNVGVADKFVICTCWGMDGSDMVEEPSCTVRARLGELLHGRDMWWSLSNDDSVEEVLRGIQDTAISFIQLNHSIDSMIEYLERDPASRRYPPGVIYLALLYHRRGDNDRCKKMFKSMKLTGAWSTKASDILAALE